MFFKSCLAVHVSTDRQNRPLFWYDVEWVSLEKHTSKGITKNEKVCNQETCYKTDKCLYIQ